MTLNFKLFEKRIARHFCKAFDCIINDEIKSYCIECLLSKSISFLLVTSVSTNKIEKEKTMLEMATLEILLFSDNIFSDTRVFTF